MNQALKKGALVLRHNVRKNSPTILTGFAVAGLISTVVMAVKATPKALEILHYEDLRRHQNDEDTDISIKDTVKLTWRCYIPPAIMGSLTIVCIVSANQINLRRSAALASIYSITESTLKEYQAKVVETIGEKKEKEIKSKIAQDKLDANPTSKNPVYMVGKGDVLFYDELSGRYFKSDMETLRRIQNDINRDLISDMWVTLNEVYSKIGLDSIKIGDDTGWNVDKMLEFEFHTMLAENGVPCVVLGHTNPPSPSFRN